MTAAHNGDDVPAPRRPLRERALDVTCWCCGAPAGKPCRSVLAPERRAPRAHADRVRQVLGLHLDAPWWATGQDP